MPWGSKKWCGCEATWDGFLCVDVTVSKMTLTEQLRAQLGAQLPRLPSTPHYLGIHSTIRPSTPHYLGIHSTIRPSTPHYMNLITN